MRTNFFNIICYDRFLFGKIQLTILADKHITLLRKFVSLISWVQPGTQDVNLFVKVFRINTTRKNYVLVEFDFEQ